MTFAASPLEFRFRLLLHALVFLLGFTAPWNYALHLDPAGANAHTWGVLAAYLAKSGITGIASAFNWLLIAGILCAALGAFLRTWGAAYLGSSVVYSAHLHTAAAAAAPAILHDGPYRRTRNPLYLGTFLHTLALTLLMPRSGALFTLIAIALLQLRLVLAEESFLTARLGPPYLAYVKAVPRFLPALRPRIAPSGAEPRWPQAFLGEIYFWAVAAAFAFFGWRYNATLLLQCVLIAFGLSLLLRALIPRPAVQPSV